MRGVDGAIVGIKSLASNWLRSLLSVLGVVIGVGTLVVMISIGEGTKQQILRSVEAMGSNLIVIESNPAAGARKEEIVRLTLRDVRLLKNHCHLARAVVPLKMLAVKASYGGRTRLLICQGTSADLPAVANLDVAKGRFLSARDIDESAKVCVFGADVRKQLGVQEELFNRFISLNGQGFLVVGVLKKKEQAKIIPGGVRPNVCVFIPTSVSQEMSEDPVSLSSVLIRGWSSALVQRTKQELGRLLRFSHGGNEDFSLWAQDDLLEKQKKVTETLQKALGAIALISLVIAGIGIMNVLLASVSERIREIGIRKAVGANPLDVLMQFVWESLLLTVTGGIIGIAVGIAAGSSICRVLTVHLPQAEHRWMAITSPQSVLISFGFALVTGLFFGLYPAVKAAKLDPCEALAYE